MHAPVEFDQWLRQLVFPEVEYHKVRDIRGMNITICTTARDNNGGYLSLIHI